jgi:hypothetical protein
MKAKRQGKKHSKLGRELIAGAKEALAHVRGEIVLPSYTVDVPKKDKQ